MKNMRNDPLLKQRRRELRKNQTEVEKTFWLHVRNRQFYGLRFFRQYSIGPYILDFYCTKLKLAIELDGGQHAQVGKQEYDEARSAYLKAEGVDVLRFWNNDVLHNMDGVLSVVAERITPALNNPTRPPLTTRGGGDMRAVLITPSVPLTLRGRPSEGGSIPPLGVRGGEGEL